MPWTSDKLCVRDIIAEDANRFDLVDKMWRIDGSDRCGFFYDDQVGIVDTRQRDDADDSGRDTYAFDVIDGGQVPACRKRERAQSYDMNHLHLISIHIKVN